MSSIFSLLKTRRNPLESMTASTNGVYPLPIELWQHIFSIITSPYIYYNDGYDICSINPAWVYSRDDKLVPNIPEPEEYQSLLGARLSIVMVCKSWYFIGLPMLWSTLRIPEVNRNQCGTSVYKTIKHNPAIASYVHVLFIAEEQLSEDKYIALGNPEHLIKAIPLFTNMTTLVCSFSVAAVLSPNLQVKSVHIHGTYNSRGLERFWTYGLAMGNYFWYNCTTLSLTHLRSDWRVPQQRDQIFFPNLLSLRVILILEELIEWVGEMWEMPALQYLWIIHNKIHPYAKLLRRVRSTLKTLQIAMQLGGHGHMIDMAGLEELYLYNFTLYGHLQTSWKSFLQAQTLQRIIFDPFGRMDATISRGQTSVINEILNSFPSVKELRIIAPQIFWAHPRRIRAYLGLDLTDIAHWCARDLIVSIISRIGGSKIIYTKEDFHQETLPAETILPSN